MMMVMMVSTDVEWNGHVLTVAMHMLLNMLVSITIQMKGCKGWLQDHFGHE